MLFNSLDFMVFFPIVLFIYFFISRKLRGGWLLIASYYFYMSWNPKYAFLIAVSTFVTWFCGIAINKFQLQNKVVYKKIMVSLCLIVNLGILGLFKYGNFAIESMNAIFSYLHLTTIDRHFNFLLPVGISFYTFQSFGYIIDVYRGEVEVENNLLRYALFVSFFPQLVAGPIERSKNLLSQMKNIKNIELWNAKRLTSGTIQMIWGLFMKMVIADRVAILVNKVFDNYQTYGSVELILGSIGFAIQIYCDFASYSLIAIGSAKIMGFDLMENFNTPYFARNIKDFWNRWHISLSSWFKDYLYIPLGGSRKGIIRKYINLFIVFLVSGLWHGASWNFVVWGGIHGIYRVIGEASLTFRQKLIKKLSINTECFSWRFFENISTFGMVVFAWIFFRSNTLVDALNFIKRMITRPDPWIFFNGRIYNFSLDRIDMNILIFSIVMLFLVDLVKKINNQTIDEFLIKQNVWFRWIIIIVLIWMIFIFGIYGPAFDPQQFIYFQF